MNALSWVAPTSVVNFIPRSAKLINNALKSPSQAGAPCPHHMLCVVWILFLLQNICNLHAPKKKKNQQMCVCMMCHQQHNQQQYQPQNSFENTHTHTLVHPLGHFENCKKKCTCSKCSLCGLFELLFLFLKFFFSRSCAPVATRSLSPTDPAPAAPSQ